MNAMRPFDNGTFYVVNQTRGKLLFNCKYDAMEFIRVMAQAIAVYDGWETPSSNGETILPVDFQDEVPGATVWHCQLISKQEYEDGETESAKVAKLRKELSEARSKINNAEYYKTEAQKKAEKEELNACRLAAILEANGIGPDGEPLQKEEECSD